MITAAAERRALLAKCHIARKQMALDDGAYRAVMARVTGHDSAGDCSDGELRRVLDEFRRLGWKPAPRISARPHVRKIYAIWRDLKPLLDQASDETLRGFVRRQTKSPKSPSGVGAPEWLDGAEAAKVIEGLKGWLAREQARQETAHAG